MVNSKFGIAAFVLSIVGFFTAFLGGFGVILDVLAIIFAIIGFIRFRQCGRFWASLSAVIIASISIIAYATVLAGLGASVKLLDKLSDEFLNDSSIVTVDKSKSTNNNSNTSDNSDNNIKNETLGVGDTISDDGVEITIEEIKFFESDNEYFKEDEGKKAVQVVVSVVNNDDKSRALSSLISFSAYADDEAAKISTDAMIVSKEGDFSGELAPGKKTKGSLFYTVPEDVKVFELHYEANIWTDERVIFVHEFN